MTTVLLRDTIKGTPRVFPFCLHWIKFCSLDKHKEMSIFDGSQMFVSEHTNAVYILTQYFPTINLFSFFRPFLGLPSDVFAFISVYTFGYIFHVFHACYIFSRFILLHSVTVTVCGEWWQLCRSSLFSLLHSPVHVGFVADKVALGNFYSVLQLSAVSVKTAQLHTLRFIPQLRRHIKLATDSVVEWNSPLPLFFASLSASPS